MCPRRPLIAHENAFYLAGLQMELVKCLPRHLAIDLGDALTRSFSRSRHRFVAISNCDGVSADAIFVAVARNVDLNHPTDRHDGLLAEASSLEISFRSFSVARRIVTGRS
jgi:hypothetical protein